MCDGTGWEWTAICTVFKVLMSTRGGKHDKPRADKLHPDRACRISNQHQDSVRFNLSLSLQFVLRPNWLGTHFLWSFATFHPALPILDSNFGFASHFLYVGFSDRLWTSISIMMLVATQGINPLTLEGFFTFEQMKLKYLCVPEHLWWQVLQSYTHTSNQYVNNKDWSTQTCMEQINPMDGAQCYNNNEEFCPTHYIKTIYLSLKYLGVTHLKCHHHAMSCALSNPLHWKLRFIYCLSNHIMIYLFFLNAAKSCALAGLCGTFINRTF